MAMYCSKCGLEVPAGSTSCGNCGTPVGVAAAAATGGAVPPPFTPVAAPVAGSAYSTTPGMAPPVAKSGGNSAIKIILIIVAVFVCLGMLALGAIGYTAWRVARAVHLNNSTGQVTVNTAQGSFSASGKKKYTAAELGVDVYPGAQAADGGMSLTLPTGSMISGAFATSDPADQVVSFYKSKAGSDASVLESGDGAVITAKKGEKESIVITISGGEARDKGKTMIHIVHTVGK